MTSIYRSTPSKRSKSGGGAPGSSGASSGGGGGGRWTVVGGEPQQGNLVWPCPTIKPCGGSILCKTRKNSTSTYGVCDTRAADDPETCQVFFNISKKHWGTGENPRLCVFCEGDTGGSPSIGVLNEGEDSASTPWSNFHVIWKECLGARSLGKLKSAWVVPEGSPVIGQTCEAAARSLPVGPDIHTKCTGVIQEKDLLLKKAGDYLLEQPPALHFHCAKRDFDTEIHKIIAKKIECKALGTSVEEEAKQACASIPDNLGNGF